MKKQNGAILILSLILLAAITLIGLATFELSMTEAKVVNNILNFNQALIGADIARIEATDWLKNLPSRPIACACEPCCDGCVWKRGVIIPPPRDRDDFWWNMHGINVDKIAGFQSIDYTVKYIIEEMDCDDANKIRTYRITTRSPGANNTPMIFREYYVQTNTPPPIQTAFDRSSSPLASSAFIEQNTFNPLFTGYLTGLWLSSSAPTVPVNMDITLSTVGKTPQIYNVAVAPPPVCGTSKSKPRGSMGYTALSPPYFVSKGEVVTIKFAPAPGESILLDVYPVMVGNVATFGPNNPVRMTVDGRLGFCEGPLPGTPACPP